MFGPLFLAQTLFLDRTLLGNPIWQWLTAVGIVITLVLLFVLVRGFVVARLRVIAARTTGRLDDLLVAALADLRTPLFAVVAVWIGTSALVLPEPIARPIRIAAVVALAIQLLLLSRLAVDFGIEQALSRWKTADGKPDPTLQSGVGIIRFMAMLLIAILTALVALDNLGVAVTPLIAGVGIGGIAIALAAQSILGDLFASLSILFDKPFMVGDFIVVDQHKGVVERIGVKTTHLRAPTGEQLILSNSDLLKSRIQNFRRMPQRRVIFTFGVTYDTPPDKLKSIPAIVEGVIGAMPRAAFKRCYLLRLGTYSLDYEVSYHVDGGDFELHSQTLQAINIALIERFAQEKIEFAYPTHVEIVR